MSRKPEEKSKTKGGNRWMQNNPRAWSNASDALEVGVKQ